jgi:hypothetical protein
MEQLAKTCKILYDQEFLDNQKLFKQGYSHNKILYESKEEYQRLCDDFKNELPMLIKDNYIDDWTYMEYGVEENFGLSYSCPLEDELCKALTKLSKNQNNKWVKNMTDILSCAVRGLANSIKYMDRFNEYIECEECDNEDIYINFQDKFKERELCNIMIVNVINGILFDTDGEENTLTGSDNAGQMEKIIQFKCKKCDKFCDMLDIWDYENKEEMCFDCYEKYNNKNSSTT